MTKIILLVVVPSIALFAWSLSRLSIDAMAMAIGLAFGVLGGIPTALLVFVARRRDDGDYGDGDYIDAPVVYADQVTPYSHLARRMMQLPALPERQAQIDQLRAVLDYIEANEAQP